MDAEEEGRGCRADAFQRFGEACEGRRDLRVRDWVWGRLGGAGDEDAGEGGVSGGLDEFGTVLADQGGEKGPVGAVGSRTGVRRPWWRVELFGGKAN